MIASHKGAVQAIPLAPGQAPADIVIKVEGGCGPGFHRGCVMVCN
jgi:hypothetical protein